MNDNKSNNRTKTIKARLSESEYQAISEQRQASGLNESEFVRRALLGVRISGSGAGNQKAMVHICQLHTLLNQAQACVDSAILDEIQEEVSALCRCIS